MVLRLLGTVVLLSSLTAFAGEADCPQEDAPTVADQLAQHVKGCPNNEGMASLCGYINGMTLDSETSNKYRYQTLIKNAACVSSTDSPSQVKSKIAAYWEQFGKLETCNNPNFNQPNGSIVKFAIAKQFDNFIIDVSHNWKLNLNNVDPADGRTALDYAYDEYAAETARGSSIANKIKTYITILENNGAKRSKDL